MITGIVCGHLGAPGLRFNGCCWQGNREPVRRRLHDTRVRRKDEFRFSGWKSGGGCWQRRDWSGWPRSFAPGTYALGALGWYGLGRFWLEPLRAPPDRVAGRFTSTRWWRLCWPSRPAADCSCWRKPALHRLVPGGHHGDLDHRALPRLHPAAIHRDERDSVTILFGGLHWRVERVIQGVLENLGYRAQVLPTATGRICSTGREVADIGQCCPTSFTTGNLVNFLATKAKQIGADEVAKNTST